MGTTDNTAADDAVRNLQTPSANRDQRTASTNLAGSVGIGGRNTPDDVKKVSGALAANGLMHAPQAHADGMLFKGIIGAQERMDSSLKRDGLVNPGGPTERTFSRLAGQGFVKPVSAPPTATGDAALNARLRADAKHDAVATAEARIKADLGDDSRSDFRKAQDRDRLQKAREDADRADARARHEQAERTRRLQEKRAADMHKAAADARKDALSQQQRAAHGMTAVYVGAKLHPDAVVGEFNRALGVGEEEFYKRREKLLDRLKRANELLDPIREVMSELSSAQQRMNSEIAHARRRLAQAQVFLRRCEGQ